MIKTVNHQYIFLFRIKTNFSLQRVQTSSLFSGTISNSYQHHISHKCFKHQEKCSTSFLINVPEIQSSKNLKSKHNIINRIISFDKKKSEIKKAGTFVKELEQNDLKMSKGCVLLHLICLCATWISFQGREDSTQKICIACIDKVMIYMCCNVKAEVVLEMI